jgi:hypothetical protein
MNSMERESAFSSRLLTRPVERIQSTCCILSSKNYRLANYQISAHVIPNLT